MPQTCRKVPTSSALEKNCAPVRALNPCYAPHRTVRRAVPRFGVRLSIVHHIILSGRNGSVGRRQPWASCDQRRRRQTKRPAPGVDHRTRGERLQVRVLRRCP